MSQMTITQMISRMPPELAVAYLRLGGELAAQAAMRSMPGHSTLPSLLQAVYPCGCVLCMRPDHEVRVPSDPIPDAVAPESASAADYPDTPGGDVDSPTTRWGIS